MEGECRGPGSSRKKRPNRLFQLNLSMAINGFLAIACDILPIVLSSRPYKFRFSDYNHLFFNKHITQQCFTE